MSAPMASTARGVTRVLLLADAPVLRRGLVSMINETAGMQSVGTPGELRRALTLVESARPDAVVVELGSGRAATLNACRDLRRRFPRVAIVALAASEDAAVVNEALAAGVRGYLMMNTSPTLLGWAILAARAGRTVVDPQIRRVEPSDVPAAKPFTPEVPLTRRESDVLDELLQGQSNRQIGRNLFISEDTVKSHVKAILRKLGARDRAHAVSLVLSNRQPGCTCGHAGTAAGLGSAELPELRDGYRRDLIPASHLRRTTGRSSSEGRPVVVSGGCPGRGPSEGRRRVGPRWLSDPPPSPAHPSRRRPPRRPLGHGALAPPPGVHRRRRRRRGRPGRLRRAARGGRLRAAAGQARAACRSSPTPSCSPPPPVSASTRRWSTGRWPGRSSPSRSPTSTPAACTSPTSRRCAAPSATWIPAPDYVLTDGFPVPGLARPGLAVWKGDRVAACVAAASVLAKVTRDRMMLELHERWPEYDFAGHKGYITDVHSAALERHGPCPEHRMRFVNVRSARDAHAARGLQVTAPVGMVDDGDMVPAPEELR